MSDSFQCKDYGIYFLVNRQYDLWWWIGIPIKEFNQEQEDIRVTFMHPHGPLVETSSAQLARNDDKFICKLGILKTTAGQILR